MNEEIYAPPEADVDVVDAAEPDFYVVGIRKFLLLSIVTMNLYFVYWFYRNFRNIKQHTGESLWPVARAIFYIFFSHSLFNRVQDKLVDNDEDFDWNPGGTAAVFVILTIASSILGRLSWREIGSPTTDLIGLALVPLLAVILVRPQKAANLASGDPGARTNSGLTLANWIWIVLGAIVWLLAILGIATYADPDLLMPQ